MSRRDKPILFWRDSISGKCNSPAAACLRAALRLAETPYALAMALRNRRYDQRRVQIFKAAVPVVSVGPAKRPWSIGSPAGFGTIKCGCAS
jgi:hypothetical protein